MNLAIAADEPTPQLRDLIVSYPLRLCVYAGITCVTFIAVHEGAMRIGPARMGAENGWIETAQLNLALIAAVFLFAAAKFQTRGRAGLVFCGAIVAYAAAREADLWFETLFFEDAYKYLVGLPMAIMAVVAIVAQRRRIVADSIRLFSQPAATLFAVAGILLCFVCQMLDRPGFWTGITMDAGGQATKAMLEESMELFAYLLIACSGIEALIYARQSSAAAKFAATEDDDVAMYKPKMSAAA